jgi:hypothetical protein
MIVLIIFSQLLFLNIAGTTVLAASAGKNRAPTLTNNSPLNGATGVSINPQLSVTVRDPEGALVSVWFSTNASGTWRDIGVFSLVPSGTYSVKPTNMGAFGTKYFWRVRATDGYKWTEKTWSFTTVSATSKVLQLKWTATGLPTTRAGVLIANVLGDAREEIIHAGVGKITVLDGSNGSPIWSVSDSTIQEFCQPQIADLNLDSILEIVVPLERPAGLLVLHGNTGSTYWKRTDLGLETYSSPVIYDVDADGYPEIFFGSTDVYHGLDGTGRVTALSYDGRILRQTFAWRPCGGGLSLGDTDSDGEFELYMGDRNSDYGNGTISFWARNLTQRWNRKDIMESSNIPVLADVTKDGILDVVVGDLNGGLAVFKSSDGNTIRKTLGIPNDAPVHYQFSVYDIDRDGNLEMMMADGSHNTTSQDVVVWDLVRWTIDARMYVGSCFYGPQVGDVTDDGIMEMLVASSTGIFIFDKSYSLIFNITGLHGTLNYAVIQDIDNDGYNELVISSSGGVVYAFDTPARKPNLRPRSEVQFYSEYRNGAAEYVPPPGPQRPVIGNPNPLGGKTDVPLTTTELSFYLKDYQNNLMNYTVVTTPNIGAASATNVKSGRFTVPITKLAPLTYYAWKVSVTDGKYWTNTTFTFKTEAETPWVAPWLGPFTWMFRKAIRIDHTMLRSSLSYFPLLINITDQDLKESAQYDGGDIIFVSSNGAKLDHEIELYDPSSGSLVAWVEVPFISSTIDTKIYMYYGNSIASNQQNPRGTWASDYILVQHLEEISGTRYDSTSYANNAATYGSVSKSPTGKIDGADNFASSGYERVSSDFLPTSAIAVEMWFRPSSYSPTIWTKFINTGPTTTTGIIGSQTSLSSDKWCLSLSWDSGTTRFSTGDIVSNYGWIHVAITWNGTYCYAYVNGVKTNEGPCTGTPDWTNKPLILGANLSGGERFSGTLDEIRISNVALSESWIKASYSSQNEPSAFCSIGIEEQFA